ncbi:MAG: triose-phosphate isomerase [Hyphomicrobium sp.]
MAKNRPLVAGNWKMNGLKPSLREAIAIKDAINAWGGKLTADVMVAPPATLLMSMALSCGDGSISFAGQDCHAKASGAHTGDVSAEMLAEAGAVAVIVGHSERRADHGETSAIVRAKAEAAHRAKLAAIVCIGETAAERGAGKTLDVVREQLAHSIPDGATAVNLIVAYEPVWAIGTGLTPTPADVAEVHAAIRADLLARFGDDARRVRILYGGSVKPDNAAALLSVAEVDGALVGGASLKANDFLAILRAYLS